MLFDFLALDNVNFPLFNQLVVIGINVVGIVLATLVVLRNSLRDRLTSVYLIMTVLMLLWIDFAYLARVVGEQNLVLAELFLRIAWVATPPFFAYVYMISMHLLRLDKKRIVLHRTVILSSLVLSAATAFGDIIIAGVSFSGRNLDIQYGAGFYPFLAVITLYIVATLVPMFMTKVASFRKQRVRIFLIGVGVFYLANIIFNISLPVFFGITHLYYFGDYSLFFLLGFTAYAIIRYQFLDIRATILRSLSFLLLLALFMVLYAIVLVFATPPLARVTGLPDGAIAAVGALIAVGLSQYGLSLLKRITKRVFFQHQVDLRARLVEISRELSQTIKINEITEVLLDRIQVSLATDQVSIYLQDVESDGFTVQAATGRKKKSVVISRSYSFVQHLDHAAEPVVRDALLLQKEREDEQGESEIEKIEQAMNWLDAAVVLPLHVDKGLTGFILLGPKLSGRPYSQNEVEFLSALAPQAATALENARLYLDSLEFGKKLQSEVKAATSELQQANDQLRQLDKAKSEFLSIASHQLYTPLTAIRGYISMIIEGDYGEIKKEQKPVFDILNKSTERLIDLIKNLLDISRIESGRLKLDLELVDLVEMAKELVQDLLPNAMQKNLRLEFHRPSAEISKVVADPERIRQVILNFVDNAIKYTKEGRVDVDLEQVGNRVLLKISDTGIGLTQEEINRLFTKFTRVGEAQDFHTEGQGLGLYVARQIVREHHGDVETESDGHGKGSTFTMSLPVPDSPESLKIGEEATVVIKAASDEDVN